MLKYGYNECIKQQRGITMQNTKTFVDMFPKGYRLYDLMRSAKGHIEKLCERTSDINENIVEQDSFQALSEYVRPLGKKVTALKKELADEKVSVNDYEPLLVELLEYVNTNKATLVVKGNSLDETRRVKQSYLLLKSRLERALKTIDKMKESERYEDGVFQTLHVAPSIQEEVTITEHS